MNGGKEKMNRKIILVSHGKLSEGMAHSVQMICGEQENLSFYGMMPGETFAAYAKEIKKEAERQKDTQFLIIGDLFGGSVCNECTELTLVENITLIAGMNMALVILLLLEEGEISQEMLQEKIHEAQKSIKVITIEEQEDGEEEFF